MLKTKAVNVSLRHAAAVWSWAGRIDDAWRRFRLLLILVGLAIASVGWILPRGPVVISYLGVGLLLGLAMGVVGGLLWIRSMLLSPTQRRKRQASESARWEHSQECAWSNSYESTSTPAKA